MLSAGSKSFARRSRSCSWLVMARAVTSQHVVLVLVVSQPRTGGGAAVDLPLEQEQRRAVRGRRAQSVEVQNPVEPPVPGNDAREQRLVVGRVVGIELIVPGVERR